MENRRNYYRVLHVQPDAPVEVIKETYLTLMQKLKMHPDLGGDTWNAALVNAAYSVLSDPQEREECDHLVLQKLRQRHAPSPAGDAVPDYLRGHCLSLQIRIPDCARSKNERFVRGLSQPVAGGRFSGDESGAAACCSANQRIIDIEYYTYWPQSPHSATARDFSAAGIAIVGDDHFFIGQLIKIESTLLHAVAKVKHCEAVGASSSQVRVGLKFITASFNLPRGTFVAITA